ncbi:acetyl-CoA acetyltransferase [Amycolatopsis bartoniae]|uniref:Thiolase n=1 Tax=Amycolatopsis bartoniae TaxID=941986 RepID=A0A8H9ISR7_9PSEU|nr:thiolase family protein [Amycolatopsis bartoniae]MBB2940159.1 acetyl-CoA acetyltransferase [Amycolatopsis bartoniae]TVT06262.1 thiolase family protein [Amycolatopsis bartoniae]GHF36933.1 thiolase [Amycolatopsis bartoniae]
MTVRTAIAGLGMSEIGKVYGYTASEFASIAVRDAVADAGLELGDLDGLIVSSGLGSGVDLGLQGMLGLTDLNLLTSMQGYGSTAAQMVQYASMAIQSGMANTIAVVWADDPLKENLGAGAAYRSAASLPTGWRGMMAAGGLSSANTYYALAARRHMRKYGTTNDHLGAIAVAQRQWATMNPLAQLRKPITLADYHASRWISEPFHLLDCCLVSNGGIALVITSLDRARTLKQPPVEVLGWAQTHPGRTGVRNEDFGLVSGAARSGPAALRMADTKLDEIDVVEVYDCYTFTALITLEDYGFCEKGEGGPFLAEPGRLGPDGTLKVNTGGGELSSYYLWGMTPLSEAVIQTRGQAGERQVAKHDRVLVSGNGGTLDHHATLVLGTV